MDGNDRAKMDARPQFLTEKFAPQSKLMSKTADVYTIRENENSVLTRTIPEQTRLSLFTRPSARLSSILGRRIGTRSPLSIDSRPTYFRAVLHIDHSVRQLFTKEKG